MTDRLLEQMVKWNIIRSEDEEIYRFGLEGLLLKSVHYMSYLLLAILFRQTVSFLLFFTAFLLLRKNAGGYHAKTRIRCYLISCATVIGVLTVTQMISKWEDAAAMAAGFILAADMIVCMAAPVENKNRLLDREEKKYFRKRSLGSLVGINALFWLLNTLGKKIFASALMLAVVCEALLLLLGKLQNGKYGLIFQPPVNYKQERPASSKVTDGIKQMGKDNNGIEKR